MENENCNIENEQVATIQPGKNIFKFDGPIGRATFLKTVGIQLLITLIVVGINYCIQINFGFEAMKYTIYIITGVVSILLLYIMFLNYAKRIYDLIKDKNKAIFYTIVIVIASMAMKLIPILNIIDIITTIAIILVLLFAKGELVK